MGFRTVVVLYNDQAGDWARDTELGRKIVTGMNSVTDTSINSPADLGYGRVVECTHADSQTLAVIDSYSFNGIAHGLWALGETDEQVQEKLIRDAAEKLGFKLVRASQPRNPGWTGSDDVAR